MTSRLSSTFSSERSGTYTLLALLLGGVLALALAGIGYVGVQSGLAGMRERKLLDDRLARVDSADFSARLVLVGDSTLGNAIDERLLSQLAGQPAANLALNAAFGLAGTANMIERAARHPSVETVIVFQALDIATRPASPLGDLQTRLGERSLADRLALARAYFDWSTIRATLAQLWLAVRGRSAPAAMAGDYIRQDPDPAALQREIDRNRRRPLRADAILPEARQGLARIAAVCRAHGLHCLYAHGPMLDSICASSRPFIARLDAIVREARLEPVAGTPLCLPRTSLGDTIDHVAPRLRGESTRAYLALLTPHLRVGPVAGRR
jgi:hypothetical protein